MSEASPTINQPQPELPQNPVELYFQIGLHREVVTIQVNDLHFTRLLEVACYLVESQFSQGQLSGMLTDKIHLFVHDSRSQNMLRLLKPQDELNLRCRDLIEIVVSSKFGDQNAQICQHDLNVHSYHAPAFCDFCGEMLWGIVRQGLRCKGCGQNYHKRCAYKIPNDCSLTRKRKPSTSVSNGPLAAHESITSVMSLIPTTSDGPQYCGRPIWIDALPKIKVPHSFELHTFKRPTKCGLCRRVFIGVYKQGLQCKDCKFNCHKKCEEEVPDNCPGEEEGNSAATDQEEGEDVMESEPMEEQPVPDEICNGNERDTQNIPLMRVVQSVKHKKNQCSTVLRAGWLFHFTNRDSMRQRKRHYWRLDTKSITLYRNDSGSNYFKDIPLSEVLGVTLENPTDSVMPPFSFRIQTSIADFYVGDDTGENSVNIHQWFNSIQQALMPVEARAERTSSNDASIQSKELEQPPDISQLYQIDPCEILGSGQFGIVYGGKQRTKGFDVAVKVVDKKRFEHKDESQLRHEVEILKLLDNPGIVKLHNMFETPEQIFVVMEKLRGDMLEMILSSERGRLPERITKFLVTQILMALRYLHSHDIVHCDLKPENVLISSEDPLPQLKLCDFGFARIIGRKSFRRSIVGTPAYLAPEVLRNDWFNRSLDMWSVGVIIYVSLSGTFPFNEDEDIHQQIQNAHFMYPPNPWNEMSESSKHLIVLLLQVNKSKRLSVDKALSHAWLQDYQTWLDLRQLEEIVGERYVTHSSDDERWAVYEREHQAALGIGMQQMNVQ